MGRRDGDPRVPEIYARYSNGATLQEIGDDFGVTRERVRQIIREAGLPNRPLSERRRQGVSRRADEIVLAFRELRDHELVARRLGLSELAVRRALRERLSPEERRKPPRSRNRYSDEELLNALRSAGETTTAPLTKDAYDAYATERTRVNGRPWPQGATAVLRFGSWRAALSAAGLEANPSSPIAGRTRFDAGDCARAVGEVAGGLGKVPTAHEYDEQARRSLGRLPSLATVRNRCGRWYQALELAGF